MDCLADLADPKVRNYNIRQGAGDNQFGVKLGDLRALAKKLKSNHELATQLWATGNLEAMLLATLLYKPNLISADQLDAMVREAESIQVAEWLTNYVVKVHPDREFLRERWMQDSHPMAARAGWSLTADRIVKQPEGLDLNALLDRIEAEMATANPAPQWTMNFALGYIGIHHPEHRARALAIGERLGVYRDYPCSKGCTSPFVPIWINEMVRRQETA